MLALELILMFVFGFVAGYWVSYLFAIKIFEDFKNAVKNKLLEHGITLTITEKK